MLAGYLPFDDDPANPEGDNINLLYKYIVSTPLTFPEYVTPHARDLLRRILVPDPRKRADLFEVARHSWLSEYSNVVGFITSSTTTSGDIRNTTVGNEEVLEAPVLARSASVREPTKSSKPPATAIGDLSRKHGNLDQDAVDSNAKAQKDNKRRTVQVEYVAPRSQTVRGEDSPAAAVASSSKTRARSGSQGPVEVVQPSKQVNRRVVSTEKPLPQEPRDGQYQNSTQTRAPSSSQRHQGMNPPTRPGREPPRAVSDNAYMAPIVRPTTGGSMTSTASGRASMALHSRNSYGLPVAPVVAGTNAHGRIAQPKGGKAYNISSPLQDEDISEFGRPSISQVPSKFAKISGFPDGSDVAEPKANHKRSNTVSGISEKLFGRRGSFFGGKSQTPQEKAEKPKKSYPPVSMQGGLANNPRQSMESARRSISFGLGRKRSGSIAGSGDGASTEKSRRFSLLPSGFSLRAIGIGKDGSNYGSQTDVRQDYDDHTDSNPAFMDPPTSRGQGRPAGSSGVEQPGNDVYKRNLDSPIQQDRRGTSTASPPQHHRYASQGQPYEAQMTGANPQYRSGNGQHFSPSIPTQSDASLTYPIHGQTQAQPQQASRYPTGFNDYENQEVRQPGSRQGRGVLQKNNRKFEEAYEQQNQDYSGNHNSAGSSGAARKVMDFFRRRGKAREGDDR
jgi:protein-serine/threonine kinase